MTRVLVTGGAGFMGTHAVRQLAGAGFLVRTLDRDPAPPRVAEGADEHHCADVRDEDSVRRAMKGVDVVVHAAFAPPAVPAATMRAVNVGGTSAVCSAAEAEGVGRLIVISSTIVEQPSRSPGALRSSALSRLNSYRATRMEAETVARRLEARGARVALVRPKTFVGPERLGAFAMVFDVIRRGQVVPLPGSGRNRYQLLDVRDFASGLVLLAGTGGAGVYHFGASTYSTVAEDLQAVVDHARTGARLRPLPAGLVRPALRAAELAGLSPLSEWYQLGARGTDSVVDTSRARSELGWNPERSNAESLVDAYDWYVSCLAREEQARPTHPPPVAHRILRRVMDSVLR